MAPKKMNEKAAKLLDAHVAFVIEQVTGDSFSDLVEEHVDAALEDVSKLKLKDVVSAKQVKQTARFYAAEMDIAPGIPELVGDISRRVYNHPGHDRTRLEDLLSDKEFREFARKIAEMKELRERIIREAISNPMYADMIGDVLYHGIKNYLANNPLTKNIPGAQSLMKIGKGLMDKTTPNLEEGLKKYVNQNTASSLRESEHFLHKHLNDDAIYDSAVDIWTKIKHQKVNEFKQYIAEDDVEDAFVIGFDYWRSLREKDYYTGFIDAGVDFFFEKYGSSTLTELLDEVGVSRDMIVRDVMHYVPGVLKALQKKKLLDGVVRRGLEPFYASETAAGILEG